MRKATADVKWWSDRVGEGIRPPPGSKLLDQVRAAVRVRHYSIRTEEAYVGWIRRFILFHGKRHPREMGKAEITAFLNRLAVQGQVAASTQNQALSALLFLYRHVVEIDVPWLDELVHAKRPQKLPVVLTRGEVHALLGCVRGTKWLMAVLLYGSGLRLLECLRLRVKDIVFERAEIVVREGKGGKDRVTMLPAAAVEPLRRQLERVAALHARDVAAGYGAVYLPDALARKYPNAARELAWQWIFPAAGIGGPTLGGNPAAPCGRVGVAAGNSASGARRRDRPIGRPAQFTPQLCDAPIGRGL